MVDIVIYGDIKKYSSLINSMVYSNVVDYNFYEISGFNQELIDIKNGKFKIYIFDLDVSFKYALDYASLIRKNDINSIIIVISSYYKYWKELFSNKIMAFDYIIKDYTWQRKLCEDIKFLFRFFLTDKVFTFCYNHVIYRIPYCYINYIEKEPLIKRCIIHTIDNNYYIVSSIENLLNELGKGFVKTHQSCIVNLCNVKKIDFNKNVISFINDTETCLLTEKMKKELKKHIRVI